ncbi:hypothetical protein AC792_05070 [Arthrobacter sp. RIT-PI-e]|uniref:GAP family protein n=1 Tax=Arthrobacter sp. RIT-PI-e TaxID=1681197 RepID=UPI0006764667|nr:GAP family protein [Arthrobacter sp. RIT-PI-e]KNC19736.1 hypothetical protein AC792_05070 [Arthrobacter sp. RIT-PI-e]
MTLPLAGGLLVLALLDSTSFGTLLIPIWLMLAPGRVRAGRILLFLATIAVFYFGVGVAILLGADAVLDRYGHLLTSRPAFVLAFLLGAALLAWSFLLEHQAKQQKLTGQVPGRFSRFRTRAVGGGGRGLLPLVGLALFAGLAELATMLPYLAAIAALTASGVTVPVAGAALALYCAVMVLPAVVLLLLRVSATRHVTPLLLRLEGWMSKHSVNGLSWVVGILGVVVMVHTGAPAFA